MTFIKVVVRASTFSLYNGIIMILSSFIFIFVKKTVFTGESTIFIILIAPHTQIKKKLAERASALKPR